MNEYVLCMSAFWVQTWAMFMMCRAMMRCAVLCCAVQLMLDLAARRARAEEEGLDEEEEGEYDLRLVSNMRRTRLVCQR
jgi:hypothetical protein